MRKLFSILFLSSFALFTLSCGGDDDNNDNNDPGISINKIITPSGEHEIIGATLGDYGAGDWHEGFNLDFTFMTGNIELDNEGDPTGGTGLVAYFEMISTTNGELIEGTYTYASEDFTNANEVFTYTDSSEIIDVSDAANFEFTLLNDPQGNVTIERSGNSYSFTYSSAGYSIEYTGVPTYYDYTSRYIASKVKDFFK
jgi:hypothetical protein